MACILNPRENRWVTFACSESYHVSPSGGPRNGGIPDPHCGCGRNAWTRGEDAGKPGYTLFGFDRYANCGFEVTSVELIGMVNKARSAAFVISSPALFTSSSVSAL